MFHTTVGEPASPHHNSVIIQGKLATNFEESFGVGRAVRCSLCHFPSCNASQLCGGGLPHRRTTAAVQAGRRPFVVIQSGILIPRFRDATSTVRARD